MNNVLKNILNKFSVDFGKRSISNNKISAKEISIPVPWGKIRGKWWGPTDVRPILTMHGWQDNCGTFERLIPLLNNNLSFLCIDKPGHGYSSHLPRGVYYNYDTYLLTVRRIKEFFKWNKISLMGHSMGGITSYSFTMLYPEEVDFLICIDGAKPLIKNHHISSIAKEFNLFMKIENFPIDQEPPSYSIEEIKRKIHEPNNKSVSLEYAHFLMERKIAPSKIHPGKFYFMQDPRLKAFAMNLFFQHELVEAAERIKCPIFITKSTESEYYEEKEHLYRVLDVLKHSSSDFNFNYIKGTHHCHLNNPEELAVLLDKFISKYYIKEQRNHADSKDECIFYNRENKLKEIS